jgi:16S rRNA (uracil1498-N3)-methyltransferase
MHRLWVPEPLREGNRIRLKSREARRVRNVLRLGVGDRIRIFHEGAIEAEAEIVACSQGSVELQVLDVTEVIRESPLCVRLFQALLKGVRMDWALQKATELGVHEIGVMMSRRSVPRPDGFRWEERLRRWRSILMEATRQCGRTQIPSLSGPWSVESLCQRAGQDLRGLRLVLWEGRGENLRAVLEGMGQRPREIWVAVGPEGGWEAEELSLLEDMEFRLVRVGPRILRAETAGPVVLSILQYLYGDLA